MTRAEIARQRLLSNLKTLTEDVEELMKATAEQADDGLSSLRGQVRRTLQSIRHQLIQKEDILKEALRKFLDSHRPEMMERFVREDTEWGLRGDG